MAVTYFYCSSDGTRTTGGGTTTKRTGAFSAMAAGDKYRHPGTAIADSSPPVAGDVIVWDAGSTDSFAASNTYVTIPAGVELVTANTNNCDQYQNAAANQITAVAGDVYSLRTTNQQPVPTVLMGPTHQTGGSSNILQTNSTVAYWFDYAIQCTHVHTPHQFGGWGASFVECNGKYDYTAVGSGQDITLPRGHSLFLGTEFNVDGNTVFDLAITDTVTMSGVKVTGSTTELFETIGTTSQAQNHINVANSELPSAWVIDETSRYLTTVITIQACDSAYQYYQNSSSGEIDFVTNVSYNNHDTLDDGVSKGSFEFDTNSTAACYMPLLLGDTGQQRVLSAINTEAASKKKVRLRFVCGTGFTLDSKDVWVYVGYPDASISYRQNWAYHRVSQLEAGAALPTETTSATWSGTGLATNAYYLDIDMVNPGNGRVTVIPGICKADVIVYVSWQLEFVA